MPVYVVDIQGADGANERASFDFASDAKAWAEALHASYEVLAELGGPPKNRLEWSMRVRCRESLRVFTLRFVAEGGSERGARRNDGTGK